MGSALRYAMLVIGTNLDVFTSLAMSLVAGGTNVCSLTHRRSCIVGDSIVVASKSSDLESPHAGQIYFNTTSKNLEATPVPLVSLQP